MPDLETFKVQGFERIEIVVKQPTDRIVLNAVDLGFVETFVESNDGTRLFGRVHVDESTELATILFDGVLGAGAWTLNITFQGSLIEKLKGFYRSIWIDNQGGKHVVAATHFEPTHARRAFPCFDEPHLKATFKIFLDVDEHLTALSNARALNKTIVSHDGKRKKRVEFAETMLLSTYLVAFVIGEFNSTGTKSVNGTDVRVLSIPGKEHLGEFALEAATFAIDFYERYFEIAYPCEKVDHIAIPDFPIGAMENLGLITFRETALLVDRHLSSHAGLLRVAEIVMHELAHMWFGDLVTMHWWNGLWLKESFATFMANVCLDQWQPQWSVWDDFALARSDAMETDALDSTHAIENPVNHPDQATEMFDVISYQKGCSVLYQLHQFVGEEVFRRGCALYLKRHSFKNSETHQLWDALEEAARQAGLNLPVRKIMDAWVFNPGHPVVSVRRDDATSEGEERLRTPRAGADPSSGGSSRAGADPNGFIVLTQQQFRLNDGNGSSIIYPIPVAIRVENDYSTETKKCLMEHKEERVYIGEQARLFVVNSGGSGFFRVIYDPSLVGTVTGNLSRLSTVERFNLINDAWSTVRAGLSSVEEYIKIVSLYAGETASGVWQVIYDSLDQLSALAGIEDEALMSRLVWDLCQPTFEKLGWHACENEAVETKKLRALVVKLLGIVGKDRTVRQEARTLYDAWRLNSTEMDAELVPSVVQIVAFDGDEDLFDEFLRLSKEANTPQDTIRFLYALARFRKEELLAKTTSLCLSPEVRSQDAPYLMAALLRNRHGATKAWEFLKTNFESMKGRFPDLAMHKMISALATLDTPEMESDVRKFFTHHKMRAGESAVRQMLEQLHINVRLRKKETSSLKRALEEMYACSNVWPA